MSNQQLSEFRDKFRLNDLTFYENEHWIASVRPEQITLGSTVVSTRTGLLRFGELTPTEGATLVAILGIIERALLQRFSALRINVIALMMVDPIIHFHVFPRYDSSVHYGGLTWKDQDWPGPPVFRRAPTADGILQEVKIDLVDVCSRIA